MCVISPLIVAIISHFTVVHESFDNIGYLWLSILFWLMTVLTYPQNGVFYVAAFGSMCMVYGLMAITALFQL